MTMGNQNNLLSRSQRRQDGGVERRPSTTTTTTTTTSTTRTASSVTTTASRWIASNVIKVAKGGGRPSIDEDTNHSCKILHHLRISNLQYSRKKNREREKLYTAREADQKSKRASLTDLY